MQMRNKAGGIIDRRFGENDPTMAPEDRMLERFTREKQKRVRGGNDIFNLEDEDELTHFGQSLGGLRDDFEQLGGLSEEEDDETNPIRLARKRQFGSDNEDEASGEEEEGPERKKSKTEVMKEVVAKSKLHKYERQKTKEDDEEEREKLDAEMGELWSLLGARQPSNPGKTGFNEVPLGERGSAAKAAGTPAVKEKQGEGEEYDQAVREMTFDKRSKPTDRTKTEEEKAAEESERLKKLEEARQRRMKGEEDSEDGEVRDGGADEDDEQIDDATLYGLGGGIPQRAIPNENPDTFLDGDYEVSDDGFVDVDNDGMIHGDADLSDNLDTDDSLVASGNEVGDSDEDDFLANILPSSGIAVKVNTEQLEENDKLAFTFPCPQTHKEMLQVMKGISVEDVATVVQRIRILHHPKLAPENKERLRVCD
jgi:nucleolar protein 14